MIYVNDNGELIEINRHEYISEKQYYSKVSEMFKSYINATEKDRTMTAKNKLENSSNGVEICVSNLKYNFSKLLSSGLSSLG